MNPHAAQTPLTSDLIEQCLRIFLEPGEDGTDVEANLPPSRRCSAVTRGPVCCTKSCLRVIDAGESRTARIRYVHRLGRHAQALKRLTRAEQCGAGERGVASRR